MVWKEPGKDKDPWNSSPQPADLERMLKNWQRRLSALFGGGRPGAHQFHATSLLWLIPLIVAAWLLSGFYRVTGNDRGVNFVFGQYTSTTLPGLHWHLPWPVGHSTIIAGAGGRDYSRHYNRLLTGDGNVVSVDAVVNYHVTDVRDFLFATATPGLDIAGADSGAKVLLAALADSAIRAAVAHATLADMQGAGREQVESNARARLAADLAQYHSGVDMTRLVFQKVGVPEAVASSYDEVQQAEQDSRAAQAEAQAYAENQLPMATSTATQQVQQAQLYKTELLAQAEADSARFNTVLAAYKRAPGLTRDQLYFETMEEVLGRVHKVVMDGKSGNVTVYFSPPPNAAAPAAGGKAAPSAASSPAPAAVSAAPPAKGGA